MRALAKLLVWWMPAAAKSRACREVSSDFAAALSRRLRAGGAGVDAYRAAARETGVRAGNRLKSELGLGSSFDDAELAWQIVMKASGMKFTVERRPSRSLFRHLSCPLLAAGGAALCEDFCLPMVEGLTEAICPSCRVEIAERPSDERPCVKALIQAGNSNAG